MREGGTGGIWEAPFKSGMTPLSSQFGQCHPPYSGPFFGSPPQLQKKTTTTPSQGFNFFNILYYSPTSRYCAHNEDNIYNTLVYYRDLFIIKNQKERKSISDLLVMSRPERVAFGLSLAS